jgi:carbonic anhydrase
MDSRLSRRSNETVLTGLACGLTADGAAQEPMPADGLQRLKDGNERFIAGQTQHAHASADWRKQLTGGQQPFATILGCSDSRVPIELVFDQGFGDLFVVRVAGNVIAPDIVGTIEYAVAHLRTPLVVILGHEGCGAVTAAVQGMEQAMEQPARELPGIKALIHLIEPGLPKLPATMAMVDRIRQCVEANVRWSMKQFAEVPEVKAALSRQRFQLVGGVYDLQTGRVRFLD